MTKVNGVKITRLSKKYNKYHIKNKNNRVKPYMCM